jgi:2-succinyl-6-hydroxy-2,4-cyclohexadiene-1-carboxylate synthase
MNLTALHGFLGRPRDWTDLFHGHLLQDNLQAEDIFAQYTPSMWQWAKNFNAKQTKIDKKVLLGYSLGGRLALHALISNPEVWSSAVIVSAHLGLNSLEKKNRLAIDEKWANRFEVDPWNELMNDWNHLDVFKHDSFHFERDEKNYSRETLSAILKKWSLSQQDDLHQDVSNLPMPILWIAGAEDVVYARQSMQLRLCHPRSQIWIVPEAGHRVPWQHPEKFLKENLYGHSNYCLA